MRLLSRRVLVCTFLGIVVAGTLAGAVGIARQRASSAMATAANAFLASLTSDQRQKASYAVASDEWTRWHFIPASMFARNGLPLQEMSPTQRARAYELMKASLSQAGYTAATSIMQLELVLRVIEATPAPVAVPAAAPAMSMAVQGAAIAAPAPAGQGRQGGGRGGAVAAPLIRDPDLYYFTVFGDPSTKTDWGWRVEGHHVSLRFAVDNGKMAVTSTPQFYGANPAEVREGPQSGLRVLAAEEDTARALLASLTDAQKATVIVRPAAPGDIATMTTLKVDPLNPAGLAASAMTPAQRDLMMKVIDVYAGMMPADVAIDRLAKIRAVGADKITFAWAGPTERGQKYHYQIQGPTFVIEHNNTQNNGNHIHSVWRDFAGDFGRDLLAEHMAAMPH